MNYTGFDSLTDIIDFFFEVIYSVYDLFNRNWLFAFVVALFILSVVIDLILILRGKK